MSRRVKCRYCNNFERYPDTDMHIEETGEKKKVRKYYHFSCWEKELKARAFREKEAKEMDELIELIKTYHKLEMIPKGFFTKLQDLRNGSIWYNQQKIKKYKQGVPFSVLKHAYKISKKKISWVKRTKNFNNFKYPDMAELMYAFRIVEGNINRAKKDLERIQREEQMYVNPEHSFSEFKVEPAKKFPKS